MGTVSYVCCGGIGGGGGGGKVGGGGGDGWVLISEGTVGRQASSWLDQATHLQCMYFRRTWSYLPTYVPICMYVCMSAHFLGH